MAMLANVILPLVNVVAAVCCLLIGQRRPGQSWRWLAATAFGIAAVTGLGYLVLPYLAMQSLGNYRLVYGAVGLFTIVLNVVSTILLVLAVVKGRSLTGPGWPGAGSTTPPSSVPGYGPQASAAGSPYPSGGYEPGGYAQPGNGYGQPPVQQPWPGSQAPQAPQTPQPPEQQPPAQHRQPQNPYGSPDQNWPRSEDEKPNGR